MAAVLSKRQMTEEDIKLQFITPAITKKWALSLITMETRITDGQINLRGNMVSRKEAKKADYILYLNESTPIAIVEAKDNKHAVGDGLQITGMQIAQTQMSFAAWAYKWLEVYKRPAVDETSYQSTYLPRVNRLVAYFGAAQLSSIRQIDVQKFFNASRDLSMSTLKKERFILSAIFESAISNDLCISNPAKYINVTSDYINRPRRALSDEQIETFERFAAGKRDDALLMLLTGIRRGEMLGLTWEDYDQHEHTLHIQRSMAEKDGKVVENPPKWNSYRVLPLSEKACAVIDRQKKKSKYIFPNRYSKVHNPRTWSQMYKRFASRLPEQLRVTSHELRHSYGSQLWRHGVDIYTIQKLLGHKNIEITAQIYVHADTESLRAAVDELHLRHFYDK